MVQMNPFKKSDPNGCTPQQIAVFGLSGSGKTVLVSSLYGHLLRRHPEIGYKLHAVDNHVGNRLHQTYLKMQNSNETPAATRFQASEYEFEIRSLENVSNPRINLPVIWHDYPGEWFTEELDGEQRQRRIDTFKQLLTADVALVAVDGQQLLQYKGEEEKYLSYLFNSFAEGIASLRDDILVDNKRLTRFPRTWIITLTKADLLPEMDVHSFQALVIEKATEPINNLRQDIKSYINDPSAFSIGEEFLITSAAKFTAGEIDVETSKGISALLPIACVEPIRQQRQWMAKKLLDSENAKEFVQAGYLGTFFDIFGAVLPLVVGSNVKIAAKLAAFLPALVAMVNKGAERFGADAAEAAPVIANILKKMEQQIVEARENNIFLTGRI